MVVGVRWVYWAGFWGGGGVLWVTVEFDADVKLKLKWKYLMIVLHLKCKSHFNSDYNLQPFETPSLEYCYVNLVAEYTTVFVEVEVKIQVEVLIILFNFNLNSKFNLNFNLQPIWNSCMWIWWCQRSGSGSNTGCIDIDISV